MKRLELVDGAQVDWPSAGTVRDAVGNLSARIEFVVLRETAGGFVDAFLGFLEDDRSWVEEHAWSRWTSEGPPQP